MVQTMDKKQTESYEFELSQMLPIVLVIVVVAIGGAIGLQILTQVGAGFTANSSAANATTSAVTGISTIFSYLPTIGLVLAAVIVIGLLVRYLYNPGQR
jgi:type II secretory pathway component PulF